MSYHKISAKHVYEKEKQEALNTCKEYQRSCSARKIADLHRYGFRLAERLVPHNYHNHVILTDFIEQWEKFCKANSASDLAGLYKGITFSIFRDASNEISWRADFEKRNMYGDPEPEDMCLKSKKMENE